MEENRGALEENRDGMPPKKENGGRRLGKNGGKGRKAALAALLAVLILYLGLCAWAQADTKIAPGTKFAGVDYGGMSREEAEWELSARIERAREREVRFVLEDGTEIARVPLADAAVDADVQSIVSTMAAKPFRSFFMGGAYYVRALLFGGMEVDDLTDDDALARLGESVLEALACEPVECSAAVSESGQIAITRAMDGRAVSDRDAAARYLTGALRSAYFSGGEPEEIVLAGEGGIYETVSAQAVDLAALRESLVGEKVNARYDIENRCIVPSRVGTSFSLAELETAYAAAMPGETFALSARAELPEVTTEELEACLFRDELSSYTTRVGGAAGRHKNVQLTAERIDGYILNAGETMKYGPLVTPFTAENGYSAAPGYLKGKTVDMIGGGACQASSTLYAAALYANLEIVQRVNHGYASDYIGLGLDATVAEGGPEFEFRNNTLYPIKVQAEFFTEKGKDYIKITLLGTKTDDSFVKIVTEVLSTTPFEEEIVETDELAPGERKVEQTAYTGYLVKTYRNVYAGDGTLLSSQYEATSNYKARNRIVLVGKALEPEPENGGTGESEAPPETEEESAAGTESDALLAEQTPLTGQENAAQEGAEQESAA